MTHPGTRPASAAPPTTETNRPDPLRAPPRRTNLPNILTVDLEEWYQGLTSTNPLVDRWFDYPKRAAQMTGRLLDLLREQGVTATFFVVGTLAEDEPDLIARIAAAGHELAVHGYTHRFVHTLTAAEFRHDLQRTLAAIRGAAGQEVPLVGYRAPYFSIDGRTTWALDVLAAEGFRYDSSLIRAHTMLYGFSDAPRHPVRLANGLLEFPVSTTGIGRAVLPCGGFAWRLLPYPVIRAAVKRLRADPGPGGVSGSSRMPVIAYLHPWEFDTAQPRVTRVTPRERVTHFYGRSHAYRTWQHLLQDFAWGPLRALLAEPEPWPTWNP